MACPIHGLVWATIALASGAVGSTIEAPAAPMTSICARSTQLHLGSALVSGSHNDIRLRMPACKSFSSTYVSPSQEKLRQACLGGNRLQNRVLQSDLKSQWQLEMASREVEKLSCHLCQL